MKFREIFRFEFSYQVRRASTWIFFTVLMLAAFIGIRGNYMADAVRGYFFLNAPWVIAAVIVFLPRNLIWLLVTAAVSGRAAARDVRTGMQPLTHTAPVSKAEYLGGRFLAASVLNALLLLALPAGILLALHAPGVDDELLGPFRAAAYLSAYGFLVLPSAFTATAIEFSFAALKRQVSASYLGGLLLFVTAMVVASFLAGLGLRELAKLVDPISAVLVNELSSVWTTIQKNTLLIGLEGSLLRNRLLWIGIALGSLAFTLHRFRFGHHKASGWWSRITRRRETHAPKPTPARVAIAGSTPISTRRVRRAFSFTTYARQTLAIAWKSFQKIVKSPGMLVPLAAAGVLLVLFGPQIMRFNGVPVIPRTGHIVGVLIGIFAEPPFVLVIPLLTVIYAGELVWRERRAGVSEINDAAPVPEWVFFLGKFVGLSLVLVAWMALLMAVGMLVQARMGYFDFQIGLYLRLLFGLRLADYFLFALIALLVHVLVNQKYVGHLLAFIAYALLAGGSPFGIEHNLLVYGSDPGWSYTEMRGFGPSLGPWLWFTLYWAAWALLLAVVARLLWVRGKERGVGTRLQMARRRFTRPTAKTAAAAVGLILTLGGFIFYNTNVLNEYYSDAETLERRAEYERRYGQYEGIPQPRLAGTRLRVEIYPERREVDIHGTYRLVNKSAVAIDSVHLATDSEFEIGGVDFDRPATRVVADEEVGYRIYALEDPLEPGDSLGLNFEVHYQPNGFRNSGIAPYVVDNGTYFSNENEDLLPAIGYQPGREIDNAGARSTYGLAPRPRLASPYAFEANPDVDRRERIAFDAIVSTARNQLAVAPGRLRQTWTEGGRRYFHYVTDAPIRNEIAFFSANYAVREARWRDVRIQIFHHPGHARTLDAMVRSIEASLDYYTEQFGPYPYSHIRLVERPGGGFGLDGRAINIAYAEGFTLMNPGEDPGSLNLPFAIVAHEVGHQWWGNQLIPARVEGAGVLSESLAWYSAMMVVEEIYGPEHLRRLLSFMREAYRAPRTRAAPPLLRATGWLLNYRKGPLALYALSEYIGVERVNNALRRLLEEHGSAATSPATTLDLYRELQAGTPDSLQYLLHDLFEVNMFWELETERVTAEQTEAGAWRVTLDVRARKVVVDSAGVETEVPMNESVEIGIFARAEAGNAELSEPVYLKMHRIRSGEQAITVTVPREPVLAGIDPYHVLDWEEKANDDNIEGVEIES